MLLLCSVSACEHLCHSPCVGGGDRKQLALKPQNFHGQFVVLSHVVYSHCHPPLMCVVVLLCLGIGVSLCSIFLHYIGIQSCSTPDTDCMMMTSPITLNGAMKPHWNNYAIINFCSVKERCHLGHIFAWTNPCERLWMENQSGWCTDNPFSAMNYELQSTQMWVKVCSILHAASPQTWNIRTMKLSASWCWRGYIDFGDRT